MTEKGPLIINSVIGPNENRYFDALRDTLQQMDVEVHTAKFEDLLNSDKVKQLLEKHSHIIVSGNAGQGPHFMDVPEVQQAYAWIPKYEGALACICRGHQILGQQYGAQLERGKYPEKGVVGVTVVEEDKLVKGLGPIVKIWADHSDGITLPKNFSLIGKSDTCPVEIMKGIGNQYGLQVHPEITDQSKQILINFLNIDPKKEN